MPSTAAASGEPGIPLDDDTVKTGAHGMQGRLFAVCGPSGAGKSSLVQALTESDPDAVLSVSHTTRASRAGERNGVHYHFVDDLTFENMVAQGAFLEHATVFGQRYGTSREAVVTSLYRGLDVILEIDWQGARQIRDRWPSTISVFILPPSLESLRERLVARQDSPDIIEQRMRNARSEISHHHEFDYLVVNNDFEQALTQLRAIVVSARLSHGRQAGRCNALLRSLSAG